MGAVRDFVDFVDRASDVNVSRASLLTWWSAFVGSWDKLSMLIPPKAARSVKQAYEWMQRQVAPMLAVIERAYGPEAVWGLTVGGRERFGRRHRVMLLPCVEGAPV